MVQRFKVYDIDVPRLSHSDRSVKTYLHQLFTRQQQHELVPQQILSEQAKEPGTKKTTAIFNNYVKNNHFSVAMNTLFRLPGHKSSLILQLMSEWSNLNYTGHRYKFLLDSYCPIPETTQHYLLHCTAFADPRMKLRQCLTQHHLPYTLHLDSLF